MTFHTVKRTHARGKTCSLRRCTKAVYARNLCRRHYDRARNHGMPIIQPRIRAFWDAVDKSAGPDGCWPWVRGTDRAGYGSPLYSGRKTGAHRIAWTLTHGKIPRQLWVLHKCDNPPCCNPKHLFLGTQRDNIDDMITKGRARPPKGERNGLAKLRTKDIPQIRRRVLSGDRLQTVGDRYGVTKQAIWHIVHGKTWKHVA
jgi:hypothetical protein